MIDRTVSMIGQTVSHYRILSQLGSGGMGVVYEAEDTRLGRHVAIKFLPADTTNQPAEAIDRFLREARIVSSLSHPHICTLHDIGEHRGEQFMVMELLEGESLKERIARGALPIDQVLELGAQVADALDAAHHAGVIHRDIKPANLFVTRRGQAKVLDFGVAKLAETSAERGEMERTVAPSELTTTGSAVGTVAYMSPEQARGQDIDARSDLFSLGEVLYEMATGQPAFPGVTPAVIFEGILTRQPAAPSHLHADIPPEFDHIVLKALEKDRETRYQAAAEIRADLRRLKRDTDTGRTAVPSVAAAAVTTNASRAEEVAAPRTTRKRLLLFGAPIATVAAVAVAILWQAQRAPALSERDTVILADFRNRTGDPVFDDTLSEALAVQLRQSPFINLLPEQQVQATLLQMGRKADEPVTPEIARELCVRAGAEAMLAGTIASIGTTFSLTLAAEDCVDGNTIAERQIVASSKEDVLTKLGEAATAFRERLGESLASVQRYDQRIEQATTRSLEALKSYSQGMTTRRTQGDFEAVPFFRRAVEIDPEFALAHARLGVVLGNTGQGKEAEAASTRAYELRSKVSERERLYIEARYHSSVARDNEKAIDAYRLLLATYPDDYAAHTNLGSIYRSEGRVADAIKSLEEAVRLAPGQPIGHLNLAFGYLDGGRLAEARSEFEKVLKLQESIGARTGLVVVGTLTGDQALLDAQVEAARGKRGEIEMTAARAQSAAYRGRLREAAQLFEEMLRQAQEEKRLDRTAEAFVGLAIGQALAGREDEARRLYATVLAAGPLSDGATDEMVALGTLLNDRKIVEQYMKRARTHVESDLRAEDRARAERGLDSLDAMVNGRFQEAYDLAAADGTGPRQQHSMFLAGMAALQLKRWDDAVQRFDELVKLAGKLGLSSTPGAARIMLGRAHAGAGRTAAARAAYEDAFRLWKDADADLPLLVAARDEYQRIAGR